MSTMSTLTEPEFNNVAVIGLGLIGGSMAAALTARGLSVAAYDTNKENLKLGLSMQVIDRVADSVAEVVKGADLIIVAVPVLAMAEVFQSLRPLFDHPEVIITDVASVKQEVLALAENVAGKLPDNFVPGHPIAGSEKHGVAASDPQLFRNHKVILTPVDNTDCLAVDKVSRLWQQMGANVSKLSILHHDQILAQTSHLPHLLAYGLIDTLSQQGDSLEIFDYAAGGLRDFSRIAASDPTMWRDIFHSNKQPLLAVLDRYLDKLAELKLLIEADKTDDLFTLLERAKFARDHFGQLLNQSD